MSAIDDTRKLLQDLVAPDLKAIQVQLNSLERSLDARLKALEATMQASKDVVLAQVKSLEGKVDSNHASVLHSLDLDRRLEQLERLQRDATPTPREQ